MGKDLNKLRAFDHDLAVAGESLYHIPSSDCCTYVAGPDKEGRYIINVEGSYVNTSSCYLRMAPLFWLEDAPVYKGDKVYRTSNLDDSGQGYTALKLSRQVDSILGNLVMLENSGWTWSKHLSMQKPEILVKREGWAIIIHPNNASSYLITEIFATKELAEQVMGVILGSNQAQLIQIYWE